MLAQLPDAADRAILLALRGGSAGPHYGIHWSAGENSFAEVLREYQAQWKKNDEYVVTNRSGGQLSREGLSHLAMKYLDRLGHHYRGRSHFSLHSAKSCLLAPGRTCRCLPVPRSMRLWCKSLGSGTGVCLCGCQRQGPMSGRWSKSCLRRQACRSIACHRSGHRSWMMNACRVSRVDSSHCCLGQKRYRNRCWQRLRRNWETPLPFGISTAPRRRRETRRWRGCG